MRSYHHAHHCTCHQPNPNHESWRMAHAPGTAFESAPALFLFPAHPYACCALPRAASPLHGASRPASTAKQYTNPEVRLRLSSYPSHEFPVSASRRIASAHRVLQAKMKGSRRGPSGAATATEKNLNAPFILLLQLLLRSVESARCKHYRSPAAAQPAGAASHPVLCAAPQPLLASAAVPAPAAQPWTGTWAADVCSLCRMCAVVATWDRLPGDRMAAGAESNFGHALRCAEQGSIL